MEGGTLEGLHNGLVKGWERVEGDKGKGRGGGKGGEGGTVTIYFPLRQMYKPLWLIINQCHGEGGEEERDKREGWSELRDKYKPIYNQSVGARQPSGQDMIKT